MPVKINQLRNPWDTERKGPRKNMFRLFQVCYDRNYNNCYFFICDEPLKRIWLWNWEVVSLKLWPFKKLTTIVTNWLNKKSVQHFEKAERSHFVVTWSKSRMDRTPKIWNTLVISTVRGYKVDRVVNIIIIIHLVMSCLCFYRKTVYLLCTYR